jgi:SAM-dependent methyltransferase
MSEPQTRPRTADGWNQRYDREEYVFGTEPNEFLVEVAARIPAGPVLCLADGEGRNGVFLAGRGHAVTAVDQSDVGLAKATRLAASRGVTIETVIADLGQFRIAPKSWAGIVSIFWHVPPALRAAVYRRAVAGLIAGGVFILEAYTPAQIGLGTGGPSDPALTPTLEQLRTELDGLEIEIGVERRREVIEGIGHSGIAEVVQILARKPVEALAASFKLQATSSKPQAPSRQLPAVRTPDFVGATRCGRPAPMGAFSGVKSRFPRLKPGAQVAKCLRH